MSTSLRAAALLLGTILPIPAQNPPSPQPSIPLASPRDRLFLDEPGDGLVWARGADWKASFGAPGCTFVPFLGSNAPHNFPLSLRLVSANGGEAALPLELQRPARADSNQTIAIDRGPLTEVYELTPQGIEQKCVFAGRTGNGAYSVTLRVETELGATLHADGSLTFANELGGVRIGKATAIDARGATAPVTTSFAHGMLVHTVPADFAATAAFPLTIDPWIATFGLAQPPNGLAQLDPDVAFLDVSAFNGLYAAVWEEIWSAADHDVGIEAYDRDGLLLDVDYVDFTSTTWVHPRIASNRAAGQFLCVARAGSTGIYGRLIDLAVIGGFPILSLNPPYALSAHGDSPDVGGDPDPGAALPGSYCACWETSSGAAYFTIAYTDGTGFGATPALFSARELAVSKSCGPVGSARQWMLVGKTVFVGEDVNGRLINFDGSFGSTEFVIAGSSDNERRPEVSSPTNPINGVSCWMVVYQRQMPGNPPFSFPQDDAFGAIYTGATSLTGPVNLTTLLNRAPSREQWNPCVDTDGVRFAVGFGELASALSGDVQPYLATVHLAGAQMQVTSYPELLNAHVAADDHMRITSERSGGNTSSRYMAVWDTTTPFVREALAARYRGHLDLPPSSYFDHASSGCGPMQLVASGLPALGETMYLDLLNAQGIPLFLIGQSVPPVALCSGCDLGIDASSMSLLAQSNIAYTVPLDLDLSGAQVAVQGIDVFAPGGCPLPVLGFEFTLTDEIIITFL